MSKKNNPVHKILCISVMQNKGGGEEFLLKLRNSLTGYEFIIASPEGEAFNLYSKNGLRTFGISSLKKIYRGSGWNLGSFIRMVFNIKISTFRLIRLIRNEKPSLILANGLFAALYTLPCIILTRNKFIVVQHLIFDEKSVEKRVLKIIYRYAEKIVCVSNAVRKNVLLMLRKPGSEKVIIIPNGIELPVKDEIRKSGGDLIRIGIVGSITRIKGLNLVIEAINDFLRDKKITLFIYGSTPGDKDSVMYRSEIDGLIKNYGIDESVIFKGYVDSRDEIYSAVDIVINFSVIPEALPFSVLEAMAYKKIIIAAAAGGSEEIITDSENGFLVEPGNAGKLKEKVGYCIKNINSPSFDLIREMAYRHVEEKYSLDKFANEYHNLYESLIES